MNMPRTCMACGKEADEREMFYLGGEEQDTATRLASFAHRDCVIRALVTVIGIPEVRDALRLVTSGS